jgi:hypothetical protein
LQQASLALGALGVSQTVLSLLSKSSSAVPLLDRYLQALAQPGARKLALLVGINQYPRGTALTGCAIDVELQRELLIHRFGFNASDILTLTDSQATRENIETAFLEHLSEQAVAGDVVVFHFSGYGSRVNLTSESPLAIATAETDLNLQDFKRSTNTLVPVDGIAAGKGGAANGLLEETLLLLLRSLPTDNVTTILDTSYAGNGETLQGTLRVRTSPTAPSDGFSLAELAFQDQLLQRLKLSREQLQHQDKLNQMPGVVLAAAGPSQQATERQWGGFSAGLFTYALTQHLWQATPATTIQVSLSRAAGLVEQLVGKDQQPRLTGQKSQEHLLLGQYLPPDPGLGADGVVKGLEDNGKTALLWLAGLPALVLEHYEPNSVVTLLPTQTNKSGESSADNGTAALSAASKPLQLQIRSRDGLMARARLIGTEAPENDQIQIGQLVREAIRVLPRHIRLTVALDSHLERIERVDATSAFAAISSVSSVVVAGEQPADYVFGKVHQVNAPASGSPSAAKDLASQDGSEAVMSQGGYGLFYLADDSIRNTAGVAGEAVKSAVNRLTSRLKTLLAAKLLRLTANEGASRLGIRASLEMVNPNPMTIMQRESLRATASLDKKVRELATVGSDVGVPTVSAGSRIRYRVENLSARPVYFLLLGMDSSGSAIAFYSVGSSPEAEAFDNKSPLKDAIIAPQSTFSVPDPDAAFEWTVAGPAGLVEIQLICSRAPFTKALAAMEVARRPKGESERISDLFNPLEVSRAVLQDLHQASVMQKPETSAAVTDVMGTVSDSYVLDMNAWATLSFVYQVV